MRGCRRRPQITGPSWKGQNPVTASVALTVLVWASLCKIGSPSQNPTFTLAVPASVSVQRGLCVHIPCRFTYDRSKRMASEKLYGYWFQRREGSTSRTLVATNNNTRRAESSFANRFLFTGNPEEGDCSFSILNAQLQDKGAYFFQIADSSLRYIYLTSKNPAPMTLQVLVTGKHFLLLFPLREQGMNWRAKLLTCQEIQAFRKSKEVMDRFVRAYKLMLGFYGIELINEETGELRRAENYHERFWNLNQYTHNNLRITRILKCLGEMGKEHYQVHLVKFFLTETLVRQLLPRVMRSALDYFMFTVRDKQKRRELVHFAWQHFEPKHEFVWGPRKKLLDFKPRSSELLNNVALKDEPEPAKDGAAEGAEQNKSQLPNETGVVGNAADGSHDDAKGQPDSDGDAAGTQPVSKQKTSEKTEETNSESASSVGAEGEDVKAGPPSGKMKPDGKDPASDCSGGGTDSEYLKESKKRKFETNKHRGESAGLSRSPTDIEKISSNLEEVVIDQEGPDGEGLPLTEMSKPPVQEGNGGDCQDLKEADSVSAVVKRRKVDEIVPNERIAETATKPDAEATSSKVPSPEKTAEVCPTGAQISNGVPSEAQSDCRTVGGVDVPVNSESSTANSGLSSGDSEPDTSNKCIVTSMTESEGSQSCSALITGQEEDGSGQEEAGMKGRQEEDGSGQEEAGMKGRQEEDGSGEEEARMKGRQEGGSGEEEAGGKGRQEEDGSEQEEAWIKGRQEEGSPGQEGAGTKGKAEEAANLDGAAKATESATSLAKPEAEKDSR